MKKLIVSLVLLMGLSFNVNAGPSIASLTVQPWVAPLVIMLAASQVEYRACNSGEDVKVTENGITFYRSPCDALDKAK